MNAFHLFTVAGIPVSVSPWYFLLLWSFSSNRDALSGVLWAVCITIGLLVHELGHALTARYLRQGPSIMLHGFGGLTSRQRTGRDVEEALVIAMGPASGLGLGLLVFGAWYLLGRVGLIDFAVSRSFVGVAYVALVSPCVSWNLLNLIPLWPLDGGQLLRLGVMRLFGARRADLVTHYLALTILGVFGLFLLRSGASMFSWLLVAMLASQNLQALRGQTSSGIVHVRHRHAGELVAQARKALAEGQLKEASRLAHQARSFDHLPRPLLDEIWEILGCSNTALGEHEEALSYLRRAPPNVRVREATQTCLQALDRQDELAEIASRWQLAGRGRNLGRALGAALAFIAFALFMVFTTSLHRFFL